MWEKRIRSSLLEREILTYATDEDAAAGVLDLGEGDNPYGFDDSVLPRADLLNAKLWSAYPHTLGNMKKALRNWWRSAVDLSDDQILFTAGSIDGIYKIHTLFDPAKGGVIGIEPQFSDYVTNAMMTGFAYDKRPLREEDNFRLPLESIQTKLNRETSLVYLDTPHNPTGQVVPLPAMRAMLDAAQAVGAVVIADEAYGDYIPNEESAATLLPQYDNLIVVRSFSKGWGLAGMRVGYLLTNAVLGSYLAKLSNPYVVPGPMAAVLLPLLEDDSKLRATRVKIAATKERLAKRIGRRIFMAETAPSVPICLLYAKEPIHLGEAFLAQGVRTIYGENYYGMDNSVVRLRVPQDKDEERLFAAVDAIENGS